MVSIKKVITNPSFLRGVASIFDIGAAQRDYVSLPPKRYAQRQPSSRMVGTTTTMHADLYLGKLRTQNQPRQS